MSKIINKKTVKEHIDKQFHQTEYKIDKIKKEIKKEFDDVYVSNINSSNLITHVKIDNDGIFIHKHTSNNYWHPVTRMHPNLKHNQYPFLHIKPDKIDNIDLKMKLRNTEIQINNIITKYDKLSKNEMNIEEKYMFANYLINIFENANKIFNISISFDVDDKKVKNSIELMKSSNIHDKIIGIDNFISLSHTLNPLLVNLLLIINKIYYKFISDYDIYYKLSNRDKYGDLIDYEFDNSSEIEKKNIEYTYYQIEKFTDNFIKKLNFIRNRKGLENLEFETLDYYV